MSDFLTHRRSAFLGLLLTLVAGEAAGQAQAGTVLDSLLAAHRRPIVVERGRLTGEGGRWLVEAVRGAQFVVIGESHNVAEIPGFTAAVLDTMRALTGSGYLALENGPEAMRQIGSAIAEGGEEAAFAFAREHVNALQFWNDQEVAAIAGVAGEYGAESVWGLDQEWGVHHVLNRLREVAPDAAAREELDAMRTRVGPLERSRPGEGRERYITSAAAVSDLAAVRTLFGAEPSMEVARLLNTLELSLRIYGLRRGRVGYYESNDLREQSMKSEFMRRYRAAQLRGDSVPRVVAKFGHWHALKGANWGEVHALGNFLSEFARANERESFHITTYVLNPPGRFWTLSDTEDYLPIARAGRVDGWTLIDLRPIRPWAAAGRIDNLNDELKRIIFGFDAVLLIGGGSRGTTAKLLPGG